MIQVISINMFKCLKCQATFNKHKQCLLHRTVCKVKNIQCAQCNKVFGKNRLFVDHLIACKTNDKISKLSDNYSFTLHKKAFKNVLAIYVKSGSWTSLEHLLSAEVENIYKLLDSILNTISSFKVQVCVLIRFTKLKNDGDYDSTELYKFTQMKQFTHISQFDDITKDWIENLDLVIDQFTQRGSGWVLQSIKTVELRISKLKENSGGCSSTKLPNKFKHKKSLLSPNCDTECFKWCVLMSLHPQIKNKQRLSAYTQYIPMYDFTGIDAITPFSQIKTFERRNGVSINVYTLSL